MSEDRGVSSELKRPLVCGSFHTLSVCWTVTFPCLRVRESQTVPDLIRVGLDLCVNHRMRGTSESHNGTLHLPSAHGIMLDRLVRLILIVSWYPQSRGAFGAAASGIESKSNKTAPSPTCTWSTPRASLVRGTDNKETVPSDVEILTFGHELAGTSSDGEMQHSAGAQMTRHDQHALPAEEDNWYLFNVTQRLDPPDGHVSQYGDPLNTPEAGAKDQGREGSRQGRRDHGKDAEIKVPTNGNHIKSKVLRNSNHAKS